MYPETANDNFPEEIWRQVPSKPEVEASSHGRVRRRPHMGRMPHGGIREYRARPTFGAIVGATPDARHLYCNVVYRGVGNIKVHHAVCEAFHGPRPDSRMGVRHLNENGLDNRPDNLCWDFQKTNLNDPRFKKYQRRRVSPKARTAMTKREKRAGIYDNILDIGLRQLELRRLKAANDNEHAAWSQMVQLA